MVAVKAAEADRLVAQPPAGVPFFLIYGPDIGLVGERTRDLVRRLSGGSDDPFSLVKLDASAIAADSRRLADEAYTVSLFGGRRTIWVRDAGGRANIVPSLQTMFKKPPDDAVIVIDAGDLKKSAPLRTLFERDAKALAIPCYADDEGAVAQLVDRMVKEAGLAISGEARRALSQMLGADRAMTRGEIEKLTLYARHKGRIDLEDVEAVVGEAAGFGMDEVLDAAATGNLAGLQQALDRAAANDISAQALITMALRHFQSLDLARAAVDQGNAPAAVVDSMRPPVFFKRKPLMVKALQLWTSARLARAVQVLGEAQLRSRRIAPLESDVVSDVLFTLARIAASRGGA